MKEILYILTVLALTVVILWISKFIFDAVIDSNLSLFWKYVILR